MTMLEKEKQEYGEDPIAVRNTDNYQMEFIHSFVEKWDALIDWDARAASEGDFFIRVLKEHGAEKVLDVATGTGFHSLQLLRAGFDVTSVDGSPMMLARAFENAKQQGYILKTVHSDWRWLNRDIRGKYDAIVCLGNSLTHLHSDRDRRRCLAEFYAALSHDGILILDQRNYDALLDHNTKPKHTYYYCGENVKAQPDHLDDGLARFRYEFPDNSVFYLNMFPLRKKYVQDLMQQVGFQRVKTYGDFQETYHEAEPDFLIHIADKHYEVEGEQETGRNYSTVVKTAQTYYNSSDADRFYATIWGGEDIHVGIYEHADESILTASQRTVQRMAQTLGSISPQMNVVDVGAGYGGAGRYLAKAYGCHVECLNLSETQNQRNRDLNEAQGLSHLVSVTDGSFEELPYEESQFDVAWSQDAFLHSGDRRRVFEEIRRVLKRNGRLIFTDPMQSDDCPEGVLQPVLDRIHLDTLGSYAFYRKVAKDLGFVEVETIDLSEHLVNHYSRVRRELQSRYHEMTGVVSQEYVDNMLKGLGHWVEAGQKGYLRWGILHFRLVE
jgi:sarcosine/dimethylglycine N-methyltransferase